MLWWTVFFCDMIVPIVMIIAGRLMHKHTPKKINGVLGYRTRRSMKNADTWRFAHEHCGRTWWRGGWIALILSAAAHIPYYNDSDKVISALCIVICTLQCIALVASAVTTEIALKKNFTENN